MYGLGATAYWVAAARAIETRRPDALFDDPWAAALAGEEGTHWAEARPPESLAPMVIRARFFDDFLRRATFEEGMAQVVLLGAGLDTRALRLHWPLGTTVFEVDQADVLSYKAELLAGSHPSCERQVYLRADLRTADWPAQLAGAGFDPAAPAVWLAEGFLFYLPDEAIRTLLAQVSALARKGGRLGFDIPNRAVLDHPAMQAWIQMQAEAGAPWTGTMESPADYLAAMGWRASVTQCGGADADYGRWQYPVAPMAAPDLPHHWLVTADREPSNNLSNISGWPELDQVKEVR
jgi:methyltransferase (TIGR00027 family)